MDVSMGRLCMGVVVEGQAVYGNISLLSAQFCYEPTTALKNQSLLEKKKKSKACLSCSRNSRETTAVSLQWKRGIERGAGAQPPKGEASYL